MAKTPGLSVRRAASTTGLLLAGSMAMPAARASSLSGIQSAGQDDGVAVDDPPPTGVQVLDLDTCDVRPPEDADHPGAGGDPGAEVGGAEPAEDDVRVGLGVLGGHQHGPALDVPQGQGGGPADQFGADDHGLLADRGVLEVHQVLQVPGGVDAGGAVPGDLAGRAGPLPRSGGQHDDPGGDGDPALRGGGIDRMVAGPVGDHRVFQDGGAGFQGTLPQDPGVPGAADEPVQIADAISRVVTVPGDTAARASRSTTSTRPAIFGASSAAARSPAGPPPMISTVGLSRSADSPVGSVGTAVTRRSPGLRSRPGGGANRRGRGNCGRGCPAVRGPRRRRRSPGSGRSGRGCGGAARSAWSVGSES